MFEIRHHNPILTIVLHGWQSTRLDPTAECPLVSSCPGSCFLKRQGIVRCPIRIGHVRALVVIVHAGDDSRSEAGVISQKFVQDFRSKALRDMTPHGVSNGISLNRDRSLAEPRLDHCCMGREFAGLDPAMQGRCILAKPANRSIGGIARW